MIAQKLKEYPGTIHRYLTQYIGLVYKHSLWVPHSLSQNQKTPRVDQSIQLFDIIEKSKHYSYHNIVTGDQKWFTLKYVSAGGWVFQDEEPPIYEKSHIGIQKVMATIIWNPHDFYVIDFLPQNMKYNSSYFIDNVLQPLSQKKTTIWSLSNKRKIWLNLDNAKIHNSAISMQKTVELGFKRPPHPPYSPDLAPSDFFLFGYVTGRLRGQKFNSFDELEERIIEILHSIPSETLKRVFETWMDRCKWVSQHNGLYFNNQ